MNTYKPITITRDKNYGCNYYLVYSIKLQRCVSLYSQLEYHNFLTLEMNPKILTYCEQPHSIDFKVEGSMKKTIFDMWVKYENNEEEFQEIKYSNELVGDPNANRTMLQIKAQKEWCRNNNINYQIKTEKNIYLGPKLIHNLHYLYGNLLRSNLSILDKKLYIILNIVGEKKITVSNLIPILDEDPNDIISIISYGLYKGKLYAAIDNLDFSYDTYIWCLNSISIEEI